MAVSNDVWLLLEAEESRLGVLSLGLMSEGRKLADRLGGELNAVLLGPDIENIAATAGAHGVNVLHHQRADGAAARDADACGILVADLLSEHGPRLFLSVASSFGSDVMPCVAAKIGAPLVTDCAAIEIADDIAFTKLVQSGKLVATIVGKTDGTQLATLSPEALATAEAASPDRVAEVSTLAPSPANAPAMARVVETIKADHRTIDIRHAEFVIAIGKGVGPKENVVAFQRLADLIGAAIGGSRPAVDGGLLPFERQIGQTGKRISPKLVVLCGISGHDYFLKGIEQARAKIAINTDRKAPVFKDVDLGIVADVNALVPALMDYFKRRAKDGGGP